MSTDRRDMTVRVVPLRSAAAGEPPAAASPGERVALVRELSEQQWRLSGLPFPAQLDRAALSCVVRPLRPPRRG